ncbi:MAG: InlB B-repeat-containing protein, partial [Clostridia bacterium]|nr:InlB B-repeat-containing protein [Clostridia bacterium]
MKTKLLLTLALIAALCFVFSAVSCGKNSGEKNDESTIGSTAESTFESTAESAVESDEDSDDSSGTPFVPYTVTFVGNGGTEFAPVTTDENALTVTLPMPEKEYHTFVGWYSDAEFAGEALFGEYTPEADVTLYARWQINDVTVTFETNGGTAVDAVAAQGKAEIELLPDTSRYGYRFDGWYDNEAILGDAVSFPYTAVADVTLFASWTEIAYLYTYFGVANQYERYEYDIGSVVDVSSLYAPETMTVKGVDCPFVGWEYIDGSGIPEDITITEHTYIQAVYDNSQVPPEDRVIINADGSVTSQGKTVHIIEDSAENVGGYTLDMTFTKGEAGSLNLAFRMIRGKVDYAYENEGVYHLAMGIYPADSKVEVCAVTDGVWSRFVKLAETDLPERWQNKFDSAITGELVTVNFTVYDFGDRFDAYIDGDLFYSYDNAEVLARYTGTGFGLRSSIDGATFFNGRYAPFYTVALETDGGIPSDSVTYAVGKLNIPAPIKEEMVFVGWYYDEALTNAVDVDAPVITSDTTLYASYREAAYKVTLSDGGEVYATLGYEIGTITLPTLDNRSNKIFTGWYYDEALTSAVNAEAPEITSNTTLYAGWRL